MNTIAERLRGIQLEIEKTKTAAAVAIVAVTKFQPLERIREAQQSGITHFANNYAQEGESLIKEIGHSNLQWHFIGHIQSRKVKFLPDYDLIQSLDRLELAKALNERLLAAKKKSRVLIEVNIGEEAQKSGILPSELPAFLAGMKAFAHLEVEGIMVMPPPLEPAEMRRPFFVKARELFERANLNVLSMGTSDDYLVAVSEGSTMVRLGTCLLGDRPA